jgi:TonB-dependent receptor
MRLSFVRGSIALAAMLAASRMSAQTGGSGAIAGVVNDANHHPLSGAVIQVLPSRLNASGYANEDGTYRITNVPAGAFRVLARIPGFVVDTEPVTVVANQTVTQNFALHPTSVTLQTVQITSARLNETKQAALQEQKNAEQIVSVLSGDEIRSLPNANAAEAAARMPGVTAERDEGEGKFVEVRGTPPTFTNVEIDGVHVPGTLSGDRSVKLDDVPSDLLGAIEVSKTLTADMDANAIGGTVNLVSKIPEGAPRGYVSAQYGYQTLEDNSNGQGNFTYGGRLGPKEQLGFLLGGSYDRTNRVLEDVEPTYGADYVNNGNLMWAVPNGGGFNHYYPNSWSEREYDYYRTRYGLDGNLDYRFSPTQQVYLRGLWSAFFDQANVWHTEVNGGNDVQVGPGQYQVQGSSITPNSSNRGPIEHTWGLVGGGKHLLAGVHFDWNATYSGSSATSHNTYSDKYSADSLNPAISNFAYTYGTSRLVPRWFAVNPATYTALSNPSSFPLGEVDQGSEGVDGQNVGGGFNALIPYSIGNLPAGFKFGVKYYNEHKSDNPHNYQFTPDSVGQSYGTLANYLSNYTVNGYYNHICGGCYPYANFGSIPAVQSALGTNPNFDRTSALANLAFNNLQNTWSGTEQVSAIYAMQTLDVDLVHINVGVRVENTEVGYEAFSQLADTSTTLTHVHKGHSYTDVFPSALLRFALDENTNLRASVDFAIARPDYGNLIPTFNFLSALPNSLTNSLSAGNPNLKPERSVNYDLLAEHYFPTIGVLSGGLFYKQITDFAFTRIAPYNGQIFNDPTFLPNAGTQYYISQPQNGPSAWEYGFEVDYTQHMSFLPGALRGIGFDVNWTWVESRAKVPIPDSVSYGCTVPGLNGCVQTGNVNIGNNGMAVFPYGTAINQYRHAMIPRQFPNMFNTSLLYDYGRVSARLSGQYTAASIYSYGIDGSSNPNSGDNWNYPHWQIDGSVIYTAFGSTALQFQVLNLNNETFGFFNGNGTPGSGHGYNVQREYYGRTFWFGVRQGL